MNNVKWQILSEDGDIDDTEFIFGLQKAMLRSLLEHKKISMHQYESAVRLLEKKNER